MARKGDGLVLRRKTWWLDFQHNGRRHQVKLGKGINRTVAAEIAITKRAAFCGANLGSAAELRIFRTRTLAMNSSPGLRRTRSHGQRHFIAPVSLGSTRRSRGKC